MIAQASSASPDTGLLVLNAGSSSLKFALYLAEGDDALLTGLVERIGPDGVLTLKDAAGEALAGVDGDLTTHANSLGTVIRAIRSAFPSINIAGVGHRVVHGGPKFTAPVRIDETVLEQLEAFSPLAPLHQPHNLTGIRTAMEAFPGVPQVACFDTAFHRGQPFVNDTFALPHRYYEQGVRRYGFHGLSYEYVTGELGSNCPPSGRWTRRYCASGQRRVDVRHP